MQIRFLPVAIISLLAVSAFAQETKETIQPLSPKAVKGFMYNVEKDPAGGTVITYKIPGKKKSNEVFYEAYTFDNNLKFTGQNNVQENKTTKPDYEATSYYAYVGGVTSFDVTSMKLKINKSVALKTWNYEKQKYVVSKYISNETIKPKNDNGKVYIGYASYNSADEKNTSVFTVAKIDGKKNADDKFYVLLFNESLNITEKPLELNGSFSPVYIQQLPDEDIVMVFAPEKGSADVSKYVYFRYDINGNLKNRVEFSSPASALLITSAYEKDGSVYFFGSSKKTKDAYEEVFKDYAPIYSPGAIAGGANMKDVYWQKASEDRMDFFHLLKFEGDKLDFASTTPVADFKSKFKPAPGDKDASPYKGRKFYVEQFTVTPSGDYLVAGQLTSTIAMGTAGTIKSYEDIVCFHFDKNGNLKAQYGVGKMNNDKKSEVFDMPQNFYLSADGKKLYWEILEVKGTKGYESFMDAYNDNPTFYPLYFPRIGVIDLYNSSVGPFKVLGNEKFFLRKDFTSMYDNAERSITYIGHDDDFKQLWIGKVSVQ